MMLQAFIVMRKWLRISEIAVQVTLAANRACSTSSGICTKKHTTSTDPPWKRKLSMEYYTKSMLIAYQVLSYLSGHPGASYLTGNIEGVAPSPPYT